MNRRTALFIAVMGGAIAPARAAEGLARPAAVSTAAVAAAGRKESLKPPRPPLRAKQALESIAELAADLAQTMAYLEVGRAYLDAYSKGTHTTEENKAFLGFLQDYERELATATAELDVLQSWLKAKAGLKD